MTELEKKAINHVQELMDQVRHHLGGIIYFFPNGAQKTEKEREADYERDKLTFYERKEKASETLREANTWIKTILKEK